MKRTQHQSGFTIVELMIATTVFSVVLLIILASFLQIGHIFYKGVSIDGTNEATRSLVSDIVGDMKLSSGTVPTVQNYGSSNYFCVGLHRYTYTLKQQVKSGQANHPGAPGVIQDTVGGACPAPNVAGSNPTQLLGPDMQANALDLSACSSNGCTVHAHIIFYGFDNLVFASAANPNNPAAAINDPDAYCSGNLLSTQFCAVGDISTTVAPRF